MIDMFTVNPLTGNIIGDFNTNKISLNTPETIKPKGKYKDTLKIFERPFFQQNHRKSKRASYGEKTLEHSVV